MMQPQMMQPQDRSTPRRDMSGKGVSAGRRVLGIALMLIGVALMGYGAHYVGLKGNCSSSGYSANGPVAKCSGTEALSILSVFFVGPALAVIGWLLARAWGILWPLMCMCLGAGLATIRLEKTAATGTKVFGLFAGLCFLALAVLSVVLTVRKRLNPSAAPSGLAGLRTPSGAMGPAVADAPPVTDALPVTDAQGSGPPRHDVRRAASGSRPDPLDQIAKLAQLRDSGALTDEEFQREKAKLLAQM